MKPSTTPNTQASISNKNKETNPDPITGEPGSHPVGTGVGAAAGAGAGAAVGSLGGPAGAVVGSIIGGIVGGLTGKSVAEQIDPTAEEAYWREEHSRQPYAKGRDYRTYESAYRTGISGFDGERTFVEREDELRAKYEDELKNAADEEIDTAAKQRLEWSEARQASQAAYDRLWQRQANKEWESKAANSGKTSGPPPAGM